MAHSIKCKAYITGNERKRLKYDSYANTQGDSKFLIKTFRDDLINADWAIVGWLLTHVGPTTMAYDYNGSIGPQKEMQKSLRINENYITMTITCIHSVTYSY